VGHGYILYEVNMFDEFALGILRTPKILPCDGARNEHVYTMAWLAESEK
jgi:hypothetical protein